MPKVPLPMASWSAAVCAFRLPRWSELPELDLYMDQVILYVERYTQLFTMDDDRALTAPMVNNYVKAKVLPAPVKKRYSRRHIAYLMFICHLKQVLSLSEIQALLIDPVSENDLPEVYDSFCGGLECAYNFLLDDSLVQPVFDRVSEGVNAKALSMALLAAACKQLAQRLIEPTQKGKP